jgi:hypothetical protein
MTSPHRYDIEGTAMAGLDAGTLDWLGFDGKATLSAIGGAAMIDLYAHDIGTGLS